MGFSSDVSFAAGQTIDIEPGDLLLLATDGAIELKNEQGEMFGRQRLEDLVTNNQQLPAPELLAVIREAITNFHPHAHPPDDVTLMILERKLDS